MTSTIHAQATSTGELRTGPLTVPLQIIRAAGARHRTAVEHGADTLPGWALFATTAVSVALIAFGILQWRDGASPLLIALALGITAVAFTPDVLAALPARQDQAGA